MKIIIISISCLIVLIIMCLSSKIRIKITKYHGSHTDVDLYVTDIFKFHFDLDEKVKNYIKNKNVRKFLLDIKRAFKFYFTNEDLIKQLTAQIEIKKITITSQYQTENPALDSYLKFTNWLFYSSINRLLESNFLNVNNSYYRISSKGNQIELGYVLEMSTRVYRLLIIYFRNYQQIKRIRREQKENGTSN